MNKFLVISIALCFAILTVLYSSQAALTTTNLTAASPLANSARSINFNKHFQDLKVEGSILIYDAKSDRTYQHNPQRNVKDIIIVEQTPDYTIRGKTGFTGFDEGIKPQIGWYVGYLEKGKNVYFFATNIDCKVWT